MMSLHDKAQSLWPPHSAGRGHTSQEDFLAVPANGDPVIQLYHLQNFPGEILRDVQKKILITALFLTVQNCNTRNREPAKSMMIHIVEYQAVLKSRGNHQEMVHNRSKQNTVCTL